MKTKSKCVGCHSIKLVNSLGLCKRCNRRAHDFISKSEMERFMRERELMLATKTSKKAAKKLEDEAKAAKEGEEGAEGEDEDAGEGEAAAEKGE